MANWQDKHSQADAEKAREDAANGTWDPPSNLSFHGTAMEGRDDVYTEAYEEATSGGSSSSGSD